MKEKMFKKGIAKKLFSVVLTLAMVVALMPINTLTVKAESFFTITVPADFNGWFAGTYTPAEGGSLIRDTVDEYYASDGLGSTEWNSSLADALKSNIDWIGGDDPDEYSSNYHGKIINNKFYVSTNGQYYAYLLCESDNMEEGTKWAIFVKEVPRSQDVTYTTEDIYLSGIFGQAGVDIDVTGSSTHTHGSWDYTASGATLTAECKATTGTCDLDDGNGAHKVSLTLTASSPNYSGSTATITIGTETEKEAWRTAGLTVPTTISYEKADGTSLASAPTSVGSYVAKVSPYGVTANASNTAKVTFAIVQEHSTHTYGAWTVTKLATATTAGERERVCTVCGHKETVATSYEKPEDDPTVDPSAGKITNKTDATENSCKANVELTKSEIIKTLGLTSEELSKVENGVDISVKLEVAAVESKNVLASDKNVAEKKLDSDEMIGQYLDINLFKIVGADKSKVTQLNGKIKIQITIPSDVKKAGTDYFIIRVHDGVATKLELTHVSGDTYTFETDRFSTYALGYKTDENGKDVTAPKTGDNNNAYVWMMLMIAGFGVMGYAFFLKRKEEN